MLEKSYKGNKSVNLGIKFAILAHNKGQKDYAKKILSDLFEKHPRDPDLYFALLTLYSTTNIDQGLSQKVILKGLATFESPFIQEQFLNYAENLNNLPFLHDALYAYSKNVKKPRPELLLKFGKVQMSLQQKVKRLKPLNILHVITLFMNQPISIWYKSILKIRNSLKPVKWLGKWIFIPS